MNEGTATLGFDGTILYCNRRFAALLRMPLQAIVGTPIYRFIAPEYDSTFKSILEQGIERGEINLLTEDGISLPVYLSISSLQTKESPNAWCLVATDLTEQKKNEEIIAEGRLAQSIIEQANETIIVCDTSGKIIRSSNNISKLCGVNPTFQRFEDVIALRFSIGNDAGKSVFPVTSALKGSAIIGMETTFELTDCQKYYFLLNSASLMNTDGKILGYLVTLSGITERKRAEQERETTMEFLQLVNKCEGTLALVHSTVNFFSERAGFEAVGIRLKDGDDYPYFETCGFSKDFVRRENSLCVKDAAEQLICDSAGYPIHECMCGNVIFGRFDASKPFFTTRGSFWTNCTTELLATSTDADRQARTRNRCNGEGYESVALIALRVSEERLGLLQLNDRLKGQFPLKTIAMWERLADYLAVALAKAPAEESLQKANENL